MVQNLCPKIHHLTPYSEDDVSQTLYKDTLKTAASDDTQPNGNVPVKALGRSKVNRICDAFLALLEKRMDTNLHNLITAHVCKSPPDLESGLRLVTRLRGTEYPAQKLHHHADSI